MSLFGAVRQARMGVFLTTAFLMAACSQSEIAPLDANPYAPGVDLRKPAVDGLEVGPRLLEAGEYELAIDAYTRAALEHGMTAEILTGIGTANIGLGRLGQAESFLRRAVVEAPDWPAAWNNLGVLLMETGETSEAEIVFKKAFALDNGQSDSIRENLRLSLAKNEKPDNTALQNQEFTLVHRGGSVLLKQAP